MNRYFSVPFVFLFILSSLILFSTVKALAQPEWPASIEALEGAVWISFQGGGEVEAKPGMGLQAGDILRTDLGGRVTLILLDGSRLELGEDTRVDIATLNLTTEVKSSLFKLVWGRIRAAIAQPYKTSGSEFNVETPNALAGVKFTTFSMGYFRSTDTTWLLVEDGVVSLTSLLHPGQPSETLGSGESGVTVGNNPPERTSSGKLDQIQAEGRLGEQQLRELQAGRERREINLLGRVTAGGQIRPRFEYDARDFNKDTDPDDFTSLRTRVHFSVFVTDDIQAFIQLQDVRFFGEEADPLRDFDADNFDLHQGYIDLKDLFRKPLSVRLGRQELSFDEERLIGNVDFTPQGQTFDGFRITYQPPSNQFDLFAMKINDGVARGITPIGNSQGDDVNFYGIYTNWKPAKDHLVSGYFLWLEDEPGDIDRFTTGARLAGGSGPFNYRGEAYYQFGEAGLQDLSAFLIGLRGTYSVRSIYKPAFTFWYDYISGDENLEDNEIKVFNTLFATNHRFYGFMDIFLNIPRDTGNRGLQDIVAKFFMVPHETTKLFVDFHQFLLAENDDFGENNLGQEIDLTLSYLFRKRIEITFGYSHFFIEEALENLRNQNDDADWAYVMVDVKF